MTALKPAEVIHQLETKNTVFWDTVTRLDAIGPRTFLTVENYNESSFATIPSGTKLRNLALMASARAMVLFLQEFGERWTPPWPDKTNGKYSHHPEALQRAFVFMAYLSKFKVFRPTVSNSMKMTPIVYSMGTLRAGSSSAPTAANILPAAGAVSNNAFLPQMHMSREQINQLIEERISVLEMDAISLGSDDESTAESSGAGNNPDYAERRSQPKNKGKKRASSRRTQDDLADGDDNFVSNRAESSRPSLEGFPHLTLDSQRITMVQSLVNAGLETNRLPEHLRTGVDFKAPPYNANTTGALSALGLDSTDGSLNRLVRSAAAQAAGTDFGLGVVNDEDVPKSSETSIQAVEIADAIQELDRKADNGPLSYLDACDLLGLDEDEPHINNELVKENIDIKQHQVGGAANVVYWYGRRHEVRAAAVCDDAGTGKTRLAIAATYFIAKDIKLANPDVYKPSLVLCPSILVTNWVREFLQFRGILKVFSYIGDDERESRITSHVGHLSNSMMATAFGPGGVFDPSSPKTADCIVICSYSTWASRTLYDRIEFEKHLGKQRIGVVKAVSCWSGAKPPPAVERMYCPPLGA